MSDKEKIKEEIERMYKEAKSVDCFTSSVVETTLERLRNFIDSLPEERNEDFEEEIEIYSNNIHFPICYDDYKRFAHHFAEWQKQKDFEELLKSDMTQFKKCYEKGMFDLRETMMKNTVLETKVITDSDGDGIETPYEEWLTLEDTEIRCVPDGFKDGDIVKVILVKEDLP